MRSSILLWSTASGLIIGLIIDATLIGVALLFSVLAPPVSARMNNHRWVFMLTALVLIGIPLVLSVLGYLEGQLKTI